MYADIRNMAPVANVVFEGMKDGSTKDKGQKIESRDKRK
jgi:hypothetical protein